MYNIQTEELRPNTAVTNQKSFYKRAYVKSYVDEATSVVPLQVLYSYGTPVAALVWGAAEHYIRLWGAWSATTSKHFQSFFGVKVSKAEWLNMEVYPLSKVEDYALWDKPLRKF